MYGINLILILLKYQKFMKTLGHTSYFIHKLFLDDQVKTMYSSQHNGVWIIMIGISCENR